MKKRNEHFNYLTAITYSSNGVVVVFIPLIYQHQSTIRIQFIIMMERDGMDHQRKLKRRSKNVQIEK